MALSVCVLLRSGLGSSAGIEPVLADPDASIAALVAEAGDGELVVRYDYVVDPERSAELEVALAQLRLSRLRLGARSWRVSTTSGASGAEVRWTETYRVAGRDELLEQETVRLTVPEERLRHAVRRVATRVEGPHLHDPADPTDQTLGPGRDRPGLNATHGPPARASRHRRSP